jgi:membrane-associated PAP2 superfamily phosphatase
MIRARILTIVVASVLLAGSFALFQFSDLDVQLQDHLYDFNAKKWAVDRNAPLPRLLFYNGPKWAVIALGASLLIGCVLPEKWRRGRFKLPWETKHVACFLVCLGAVPAIIGAMKARSDIYCPWALERYGGDKPYHHFFDPLPAPFKPNAGCCFPGGHASGGFALMALVVLCSTTRGRWAGIATGMALGWMMGTYQMLKGAHFLSHTITTMLLAVIIIEIVRVLFALPWNKAGRITR